MDDLDRAIKLYLRERALQRQEHPEWWALPWYKRLWCVLFNNPKEV